jgi:hypothetical protein
MKYLGSEKKKRGVVGGGKKESEARSRLYELGNDTRTEGTEQNFLKSLV